MKSYTVFLLQLIIWSGYTIIEWLSSQDQLLYKVIMFLIFFYLAIIIGNSIMKSVKKTIFITSISLVLYGSFYFTMSIIPI